MRAIGQNSAEVADAVRDGRLEAGLVILPIEDRGLEVRPSRREELLYMSADPERVAEPITVERLADAPLILYDARWAAQDPTRVQLRERAQTAGVRLEPRDRGRVHDGGLRPRRPRGRRHRRAGVDVAGAQAPHGAVRSTALRDLRVHHAPQRALSPSTRAFMDLAEKALG